MDRTTITQNNLYRAAGTLAKAAIAARPATTTPSKASQIGVAIVSAADCVGGSSKVALYIAANKMNDQYAGSAELRKLYSDYVAVEIPENIAAML